MNRKNRMDCQAQNSSSGTILIVVFIVGIVIVWQFILPIYGYDSLTNFIGADEEEPTIITFSYTLLHNDNPQIITETVANYSGVDRLPDYYPAYDIDSEIEIPDYTLKIQTNAPSRISNPYKIIVTSTVYTGVIIPKEIDHFILEAKIEAFSGDGIKTFNIVLDNEFCTQELNDYTDLQCDLINPSGLVIETLHLVIV